MHQTLTRLPSTMLAVALCAAGRAEAFAVAPATPLSAPAAAALPPGLASLLWVPLLLTVAALALALVWALRARHAPRHLPKQQPARPRRYRRLPDPVSTQREKSARSRGVAAAGLS